MRPPIKAAPPDDLPFPFETIRHWFVSPFGGRSEELGANEVGVNRLALERNTDLRADDAVTVGVVGSDPHRPWFLDERFAVVPLDARTPDAAELSPRGEVVLPDPPFDFVRRPHLRPDIGDAVVLKGADRRLEANPDWLQEILGKSVRRPDF
jgi:hypothetical protein